jgi:hypothetical protein
MHSHGHAYPDTTATLSRMFPTRLHRNDGQYQHARSQVQRYTHMMTTMMMLTVAWTMRMCPIALAVAENTRELLRQTHPCHRYQAVTGQEVDTLPSARAIPNLPTHDTNIDPFQLRLEEIPMDKLYPAIVERVGESRVWQC